MQKYEINYISEFKCLASECPDTCCSGWMIEIDEASLVRYEKVEGSYKGVLQERIDSDEKVFRQKANGDCAFLCENKLCDMYTNLGEESLCDTCRLYPRHIEEFENVREMTLSNSCPEVARFLMQYDGQAYFVKVNESEIQEVFDDYDIDLYETLVAARGRLIDILQDRELSIYESAAKVIVFASRLQDEVDWRVEDAQDDAEYDLEGDAEDDIVSRIKVSDADCEKLLPLFANDENGYDFMRNIFSCLRELEHLKDERENILFEAESALYDKGEEQWAKNRRLFEIYCSDNKLNLETKLEQLMVYYVYAYFCGAVYDNYIFAKIMGAVSHTLLIRELWLAKWLENNKCISEADMAKVVYEYARELENSNPNLIKMDEMMDELKFDIDMEIGTEIGTEIDTE